MAHRERGTDLAAGNEVRLRLLIDTGLLLAAAPDVEAVARVALDAGMELSGATAGMFMTAGGASKVNGDLDMAAGADQAPPELCLRAGSAEAQEALAEQMLRGPAIFGSSPGTFPVCSGDVSRDERVRNLSPSGDGLSAKTGLNSYLAVPVKGAQGRLLGGIQYGHTEADVFVAEDEAALSMIAAQAAVAMERIHLAQALRRQVADANAVRAEQRATSSRLAHALQAAGMGTWSWDAVTDLIDFDERAGELFGVAPHVPMTRESLRKLLVHTEDLAFAPTDLREVGRTGGQYSTEYRLAMPEEEQRWVAIRGHAVNRDDGEMQEMIGTVQDITPRRIQEEALRTSEKLAATGRMAATIAHEINNPLEAVTNLIYLAKTDPETPESVSRMLEVADGELARVSQIAQQTLGFYRDTTRPVTVDVNELLNAVVELFDRKLTGKGLQCTLDLEPGLSVVGLQGEIRQVVANLLVNAIDASPRRGGRIRIRGRHRRRSEGKGITVLICDEGEGIPVHVGRRLFTPFVTTKQSTGTGLGLWVTRGMVEKHGGSVSFRSRTVSPSGTVFRVYLPQSGGATAFDAPTMVTIQ